MTVDVNSTIDTKIQQISDDYTTALNDIEKIEDLSQEMIDLWKKIEKYYDVTKTQTKSESWIDNHLTEEEKQLCEEGGKVYWTWDDLVENGLYEDCYKTTPQTYGAIISYNAETDQWTVTYISYNWDKLDCGSRQSADAKMLASIADYNALAQELYSCEEELAAIDSSSEMDDLMKTLNQLLNDATVLIMDSNQSNINEELQDIQEYINSLVQIMEDQLKVDEDVEIMEECGDEMSVSQAQYYATDLTSLSAKEVQDLDDLETKISDDFVKYNKEYDNAQADYYINSVKVAESYGFEGSSEAQKAKQEMENVNNMFTVMQDLLNGIKEVYAALQPDYIQLSFVFKSVQKEINDILNDPSLSPQEQKTQILALLIFLLGYVDLTKEIAEKSKAKDQNKMSDATLDVSQINIHAAITNQKVMQEVQKLIDKMGDAQLAMQVIITAMCVVLAPGVGMGLAMLAFGLTDILSSQGVIKFDPAKEIGDGIHSQLGGEIIWTVIEMAVAIGGGMALDFAIEKMTASMVEEEVEIALAESKAAIDAATNNIVRNAGGDLSNEEIELVRSSLENGIRTSTRTAGKTAIYQTFQQPFGGLLVDLTSGSLKTITKEAVTLAADRSYVEMEEMITDKVMTNTLETSLVELTAKSERIGYDVVADLSKTDREQFAKQMTKHYFWTGLQRATIAAALGTSYNNVFVDFISWCHRMNGTHASETEELMVEILQSLIPALILLASSYGNSSFMTGTSGAWQAGASALELGSTGAQSMLNFDLAGIHQAQAVQVKRGKHNEMITQVMQMLMDEMQQFFSQEKGMMLSDISTSSRLTSSLSKKSSDAEVEGARILAAAV